MPLCINFDHTEAHHEYEFACKDGMDWYSVADDVMDRFWDDDGCDNLVISASGEALDMCLLITGLPRFGECQDFPQPWAGLIVHNYGDLVYEDPPGQ